MDAAELSRLRGCLKRSSLRLTINCGYIANTVLISGIIEYGSAGQGTGILIFTWYDVLARVDRGLSKLAVKVSCLSTEPIELSVESSAAAFRRHYLPNVAIASIEMSLISAMR